MLTEDSVRSLVEQDKVVATPGIPPATLKVTPQVTPSEDASAITTIVSTKPKTEPKTFQDIFHGGSTNKLSRKLFSFLDERDRSRLAMTCVDARRLDSVDRALTNVGFKITLMTAILEVLENPVYAEHLTVSRNPSGFLRLNNDLIGAIKDPRILKVIPDAAELRLNFWPGDLYESLGARLEPETRHSHPRGFCSFIVHGGYKHNIYHSSSNPKDPGFTEVVGTVQPVSKAKSFKKKETPQHLSHVLKEDVTATPEGYAYFPVRMIHEVASRTKASVRGDDHGTLSINVVFKTHKSAPVATYSIFMEREESLVEVYDQLPTMLAQQALEIVRNLLKGQIRFFTASMERVKPSSTPASFFGRDTSTSTFTATVEELRGEDTHVKLPTLSSTPEKATAKKKSAEEEAVENMVSILS
ncbi:TPA: hypothetical protein ACPSKB_000483 [Legionella feeleii]|uniref:Uncharacterized protein n=1 Tax=Legionella feeleii TaxID=453 RepID=A0A378ITK8_9GAMM|nr:hypothetical protein [Legionella feeleii]STX38547.1 Uncharacterised protein [Legionella feeleii]